jgi:thiamine-phosphate pyrophosphorylase
MDARQALPRIWLMTDERLGDGLFDAIRRLPAGAGIVFRHYTLPEAARRALFDEVAAVARARGLLLLLAGPTELAESWGADGSHGRGPGAGLKSAPAHDLAEIRAAERDGAALIFLSPVHATRSHPDAAPLGLNGFAALTAETTLPVIALGGMNAEHARETARLGGYGWAGIDAWLA